MKKIMFNDRYGLTQAVLEGRKTQTRRIVKTPENATGCEIITIQRQHREYVSCERLLAIHTESLIGVTVGIPYQVEDEVAVAQRYKDVADMDHNFCFPGGRGFFNKMFVRANLMPHRIKITKIRVERLQDISEEDCLKEGVVYNHARGDFDREDYHVPAAELSEFYYKNPREPFAALIDKTCGRGTWNSNPYVFVYDFKLIK